MKKIPAWLLALVTALCLCVPAPAVSAVAELKGGGTAADPCLIGTAAELTAFRDLVNSGQTALCAVLTADITLDGAAEWTPIGAESTCAYDGVFRGGGHTISGLTVRTEREYAGLFGCLSAASTVEGVTVSSSTVTARRGAGAVAGYSEGVLRDCHTTATVQVSGAAAAGGIVGTMAQKTGVLTHCSNRAAVTVNALSGGKAGGIAGSCGAVQLTDCCNTGAVTVTGSGTLLAGGLLGDCGGAAAVQLTDAYNTGRVSMTGIGSSGGLVGECSGDLRVSNAYQAGAVRGAAIAGMVRGAMTLVNVYKTGTQPDKSAGGGTLTGSALPMSGDALQTAVEALGDHFTGGTPASGGYPLLSWQLAAPAGAGAAVPSTVGTAADETAPAEGEAEQTPGDAAQLLKASVYLKQTGRTLVLVTYTGTAPQAGSRPVYQDTPMCWSEKYQAYVCLTEDDPADVTDDRLTMTAADDSVLMYDGDVNGSGAVDINDAQLIYAVYNAQIDAGQLTQEQLLKADVNGDGVVDTSDAAQLTEQLLSA